MGQPPHREVRHVRSSPVARARHPVLCGRLPVARSAWASPDRRPRRGACWFAGIAPGCGQLHLPSDLGTAHEQNVFARSFRVGRLFGARARASRRRARRVADRASGEQRSRRACFRERRLALRPVPAVASGAVLPREGRGAVEDTNQAPDAFGAEGVGWWAGAGWEFRVRDRLRVVPGGYRSGGRFRDTRNVLIQRRGLRFEAWDLRVGLVADWR